ncbi:MAG: hypothetical protein KF680_11105 [Cryobacterium sp.]|nr:hypothetical protein [Cryobacterium sp.]
MKKLRNALIDHPTAVAACLLGLALAHFLIAKFWLPQLNPANLFAAVAHEDLPSALSSLAIGVASVAAMVGGFAGVVVVFGLSSDDARFREVRLKAATSLRRNWMSIVATPLLAAFGAVIAATFATAGWTSATLWALELCVLFAAHGALRLVVLLNELVKVVHKADEATEHKSKEVDTRTFLGKSAAPRPEPGDAP